MENQQVECDTRFMTLLEGAISMPSADREAFLRSACRDDLELLASVEQQLQWEERMGSFLLDPLVLRRDVSHPFEPGDTINDRFRILRELGEGGMGVIYEAMDERLDHRCAVKCAKPGFQRRLPPEARAAIQVTHDNVCRVYEIHTAETARGPVDFLSMEYVEGETLADLLSRQGALEPLQADAIFRQLCMGVAAAHRGGLLHRDLKTNNVMLTQSSGGPVRTVIMDFGLARDSAPSSETALQLSSNLRGAAAYIAPELWRGERASVASDLYSLGVIAYEMATGRQPFSSETPIELRFTDLPRKPSAAGSKLGAAWDQMILKCLNTDPSQRFSNAEQILESLRPANKTRRQAWIWASLTPAILAATAYLIMSSSPTPSQQIRLAVLPIQTAGCDDGMVEGALLDACEQLRRLPNSNLVVIPISLAAENHVTDRKEASARLGATHVLETNVRCETDKIALRAAVVDARTTD
jgi:serine/threonine protein kinase